MNRSIAFTLVTSGRRIRLSMLGEEDRWPSVSFIGFFLRMKKVQIVSMRSAIAWAKELCIKIVAVCFSRGWMVLGFDQP